MLKNEFYELYKNSFMRFGIVCWYPFKKNARILDLSNGNLTEFLSGKGSVFSDGDNFDYAVVLDPENFSVEYLKDLRFKLNGGGRLLLAYENPFALRYWSGKSAPGTNNAYDTLFGRGENPLPSMAELKNRLKRAGFNGQKWYFPLADHWFTQEVYSENYLPNEFFNQRFTPYIQDDIFIAFDERPLYREVVRGGAFPFMCGAYFAEARLGGEECPVDYAAVTAYREPPKRFATTVRNDGTVRKTSICPEGADWVKNTFKIYRELKELGVNVLDMKTEDCSLIMPRVDFPTLWDYWVKKLADGVLSDNELFSHFDRLRDVIYQSSANGNCYWELVPANCFYDVRNDGMIFFDQEYCSENLPPEFALARAVFSLWYSKVFRAHPRFEEWFGALRERYNISRDYIEDVNVRTIGEVFGDSNAFIFKYERAAERAAI